MLFNHQNKLSFVTLDNGRQTRTPLLVSFREVSLQGDIPYLPLLPFTKTGFLFAAATDTGVVLVQTPLLFNYNIV